MPKSAGFDKLHLDYPRLTASTDTRNNDEIRSVRYFNVDWALDEDRTVTEPSPRIRHWVVQARRLEQFISDAGRMPVENRRKAAFELSVEERTLARWKADQLRAARRGTLSTYQIRRLEGLDGFRWAPLDAKWDKNFSRYEAIVAARQPPRYRAGGAEREVARWAQRQRALYRRGALPQSRTEQLEATRFWTW